MQENEKLVLNGGVSLDVNADSKHSPNSKNVDIEKLAKQVKRLTNIVNNLSDVSAVDTNTNYFYDELINAENELIKELEHNGQRSSIVEERKINLKRLKDEKIKAREKQLELHDFVTSSNQNNSYISKINNSRKSKYVDFGNYKKDDIIIPMGKSFKQARLEDDYNNKLTSFQRADAIYGSDEEYFSKFIPNKKIIKFDLIPPEAQQEQKVPDIANVEKTLFPNGTLADMPLAKNINSNIKTEFNKEIQDIMNEIIKTTVENVDYSNIDTSTSIKEYLINNLRELNWFDIFLPNIKPTERLINDVLLGIDFIYEIIKSTIENYTKSINGIPTRSIEDYINNINLFFKDIGTEKTTELLKLFIKGGISSQIILSTKFGIDATNLLRLSKKNANLNTLYTINAKIFSSTNELPNIYKNTIIEKLKSQNLNTNSRGLIFNSNSKLSKRIVQSIDLKELVLKNLEKMKTNKISTSIEFKKENNENLFYSFHYADIKNLRIDKNGNIYGDLIDTTDYNKGDKNVLVKAARPLQISGEITPIFVVVQFKTNINELRRNL